MQSCESLDSVSKFSSLTTVFLATGANHVRVGNGCGIALRELKKTKKMSAGAMEAPV